MTPEQIVNAWAQSLVSHLPDWPDRSMIDAQTEDDFSACLIFQKEQEGDRYFQAFTLTQPNLESPGSKQELFLRVSSAHEVWFDSLLHLRKDLSDQEIVPGMMVKFNAPLAPDTEMNAWVVGFNAWTLGLMEEAAIEYLPVFPIFVDEIEILAKAGFAKFAERLGDDLYNPYRNPVT